LLFIFLVLFILIARPAGFLICTYIKDKKYEKTAKEGDTNDTTNLNETRINTVVKDSDDLDKAITQIQELIKQAKPEGKKISIAGAQHSKGGHSIYPDGIFSCWCSIIILFLI